MLHQGRVVRVLFIQNPFGVCLAVNLGLLQILAACKEQRGSLSAKLNKTCAKPLRANFCKFFVKSAVFWGTPTSIIPLQLEAAPVKH